MCVYYVFAHSPGGEFVLSAPLSIHQGWHFMPFHIQTKHLATRAISTLWDVERADLCALSVGNYAIVMPTHWFSMLPFFFSIIFPKIGSFVRQTFLSSLADSKSWNNKVTPTALLELLAFKAPGTLSGSWSNVVVGLWTGTSVYVLGFLYIFFFLPLHSCESTYLCVTPCYTFPELVGLGKLQNSHDWGKWDQANLALLTQLTGLQTVENYCLYLIGYGNFNRLKSRQKEKKKAKRQIKLKQNRELHFHLLMS